jgi:hypothetical protein
MNLVGKPDAANPHVRFDERGPETDYCAGPRLYSDCGTDVPSDENWELRIEH